MTFDAKEKDQFAGNPVECFRFVSASTTWLLTSADAPVTIGADTYLPEALRRGRREFNDEDFDGGIEVRIPRSHPIAVLFMPYIPTAPVALTVTALHKDDGETTIAFSGQIASARFDGSECVLSCQGLSQYLNRKLPAHYWQKPCNWPLYSAGCGVSASAFKTTGTLSAVSGDTITATAFDALADGWFENGWVQRANGERRFVTKHVGSVLTLLSPFFALAAGEAVDAYAGCDRTEATCAAKFSNLNRHFGFARIPQKNPYTSGVA